MATINGSINMFQENHVALGQVVEGDSVLLNVTVIDLTGNPNKATLIQKMEDGTTIQITSVVVNGKKVTATIPSAFCIGLVENQLIFTNGSQTTTTKFYYYVNRKIDIDDGTITPDVPEIDLSNYATTEYVDKVFNFLTVEIEDAETSTLAERTVAAVRQKWIDIIEENKIKREYSSVSYSKDIVAKVNVAGRPFSIFVALDYTTAEKYLDGYFDYRDNEIKNDRPDGEEWTDWIAIYADIPPLDAVTKPIIYDKEVAIIPGLGVTRVSSSIYDRSASAEYARIRRFPIVDTTKLAEKNHTHDNYAETGHTHDNYAEVDHVHNKYTTVPVVMQLIEENCKGGGGSLVNPIDYVTMDQLENYAEKEEINTGAFNFLTVNITDGTSTQQAVRNAWTILVEETLNGNNKQHLFSKNYNQKIIVKIISTQGVDYLRLIYATPDYLNIYDDFNTGELTLTRPNGEEELDYTIYPIQIPPLNATIEKLQLDTINGTILPGLADSVVSGSYCSCFATLKEFPEPKIWTGTQAEYDAIVTKNENTLYIIV